MGSILRIVQRESPMKLTQLGSNQTMLLMPDGQEFFFSYDTCVAGYTPGEGYFKTSTKFSRTTSKHINQYLEGVNATIVEQSDIEAAMLTIQ